MNRKSTLFEEEVVVKAPINESEKVNRAKRLEKLQLAHGSHNDHENHQSHRSQDPY